jgi:hypothetical protein
VRHPQIPDGPWAYPHRSPGRRCGCLPQSWVAAFSGAEWATMTARIIRTKEAHSTFLRGSILRCGTGHDDAPHQGRSRWFLTSSILPAGRPERPGVRSLIRLISRFPPRRSGSTCVHNVPHPILWDRFASTSPAIGTARKSISCPKPQMRVQCSEFGPALPGGAFDSGRSLSVRLPRPATDTAPGVLQNSQTKESRRQTFRLRSL